MDRAWKLCSSQSRCTSPLELVCPLHKRITARDAQNQTSLESFLNCPMVICHAARGQGKAFASLHLQRFGCWLAACCKLFCLRVLRLCRTCESYEKPHEGLFICSHVLHMHTACPYIAWGYDRCSPVSHSPVLFLLACC